MSPDISKLRQKIWLAVAMALVLPLLLGVTALIFFGTWPYPDTLKIFYQYTGIYLLLVLFPVVKLTSRFIRDIGENINKSALPISRFTSTKHLLVILLCFEVVYFLGVVVSGVLSIQEFGGRQYKGSFYVYSYFAGLPSVFLTVLCVFIYISDALGRFFATRGVVGNTTPLRLNMAVLGLLVPLLFISTFLIYFYERTGHLTTEVLVLSSILMVIAGSALYHIVNSLYKTSLFLQNSESTHTNKESISGIQLEPDYIGELGELAAEWKRLYEENIKTNLQLMESEQRLRQLVEYISDWIWEIDTKGNLMYASPKVKDLLGYEPEEVIGRSVFDLMPKQEAERVAIIYEELIKERKAFHGMININQHKDGHLVILESNGVPLFGEDGEWLGYRGIDRDISERHRYEKELQQERNFIDAVIENAGAIVLVLDKQGKIQRFNRACEEITLYTFEEVKGRYVWDFLLMPEEVEPVRNVFKKLEFTTLPSHYTNYWVAKDKSRHLIEWSNVVMTDAEGECDYLISIGNDVTEKYLVQASLAERTELLERVFENTHTLIAYMDTDFNFIRANQAYLDADNITIEQLIGKNHFDLYPNEENKTIFKHVVETGEPHFSYARPFEYSHSPDKGVTHWDWTLSPVWNDKKEIIAVLLVLVDVTERIRAQEALLRNEDAMKTAQSIAHFGSWDWDILTGNLAWTDEIYRIFGQEPQSFPATYEAFLDTIHPEDREHVMHAVNAAVADEHAVYDIEHRVIQQDGEIREVHEQGEVYRDETGRPIRMIGTVHDITERKKAEREMYIKDVAIQCSISAIAMADLEANLIYVNQAFLDTWGYENESEVLGHSVLKFWKDTEQVEPMMIELRERGKWVGEMDAIRKDGSEMCIRISANVTVDDKGQVLNLMASFIDITEQKNTELALYLNQELLSKAQEIAHIGSWDWNVKTNELKWSEETYRIFGRDAESFGATYPHFLEAIYPDDRELVDATVHKHLHDPDKEYKLEHRVLRPDGQLRIVLEQGLVYRDEQGQPIRMVGAVLDITEQKRAETEILDLNKQLEERVSKRTSELEESLKLLRKENEERKRVELSLVQAKNDSERANKLKSEFLGRMSHELRTPMNAILGFSQLLETENLDTIQTDYVKEISQAGKHLLALINEVLDLSRIESGKVELLPENYLLRDLVLDSIAMVQPMAMAKDISIDNRIEAEPVMKIRVDQLRFKEVLVNLLSNAVKYNSEGGHITVNSMLVRNNVIRINIIDDGPGMTMEKQELVFEPFNRLGAEYSNIEGTGIGLTIARKLVDLMHGQIGVQSIEGQGSTFWIEFPLLDEQASLEMSTSESATLTETKFATRQRVLYIEDNPANLRLVQHLFERLENIILFAAPNAELGIELAKSKQPALILLDINLPGMDGYEALSRLRNLEQTSHIPVIAISAAAMPRDIERGLAAGFRRYITKPIQVMDLLDAVEHELGKAGKRPNVSL